MATSEPGKIRSEATASTRTERAVASRPAQAAAAPLPADRRLDALQNSLRGSGNIADAVKQILLNDVEERWGRREIRVRGDFNWNHEVEGFILGSDGNVYVNIYWQGDSTDGGDTIRLSSVMSSSRGAVIPAESSFDGYRTRTRHSDIRVTPDEVTLALNRYLRARGR